MNHREFAQVSLSGGRALAVDKYGNVWHGVLRGGRWAWQMVAVDDTSIVDQNEVLG